MSYQSKYTGNDIDTSVAITQQIFNLIYPIGSIYMNVNNVSPATFIGGTWTALTDRVLIGAGGGYTVNATGGTILLCCFYLLFQQHQPSKTNDYVLWPSQCYDKQYRCGNRSQYFNR